MTKIGVGPEGQIAIAAPAKINLLLRIIGRRPDGYHELETLMQKLDLADTVHLAKVPCGISLTCPESDLPVDEGNLAFRAARAFFDRVGLRQGVEIGLEKRIPIAAGLGGGSSDAAAVLHGLDRLYATGLDEKELMDIARPLGADVPFFVSRCGAARATGIGDRLERVATLWKHWVVLVNPGFAVSTKWAYQNFALTTQGNPYILGREKIAQIQAGIPPQELSRFLVNDLEEVTIPRHPEIKTVKEQLLQFGANGALMSGSGPTVFGLFESDAAASRCAEEMEKKYPQGVFLTKANTVV